MPKQKGQNPMTDQTQAIGGIRLFNTKDAAKLVGRKPATLEYLRWRGTGPKYRKIARSVFYTEADLLEWLNANSTEHRSTSEYAVGRE